MSSIIAQLAVGATAIVPLVLLVLAGAVVLLLRRIVTDDQDGHHHIAPELEVAYKAPPGKDSGLTVFYASQKGHGRRFAERLVASANAQGVSAAAVDLTGFDTDRLVEFQRTVFIVATYAGGSDVPGTEPFFNELTDMSRDFRVEKTLLASMSYAIFGCGNSEYPPKDFNAAARRLDRALRLLGARRLVPRREGDDADNALSEQFDEWAPSLWRALGRGADGSDGSSSREAPKRTAAQARRFHQKQLQGEADAARAAVHVAEAARRAEQATAAAAGSSTCGEGAECCGGGGDCGRGGGSDGGRGDPRTLPSTAEPGSVNVKGSGSGECCGGGGGEGDECCGGGGDCGGGGGGGVGGGGDALVDEPSGGDLLAVGSDEIDETDDEDAEEHGDKDGGYGSEGGEIVDVEDLGTRLQRTSGGAIDESAPAERKPMVSDSLRAALTKQGYKVVGTHSGVKLCRWTKSMLRGRGGCYKHTFYGIVSYQCMEATPSLACANKCGGVRLSATDRD